MASLEDIIDLDQLPGVPAVLGRLIPMLADPDTEWTALERVVRQDEALTASLLRLANSALYRARGSCQELGIALKRLGRAMIRRCVLRHQLGGTLARENAAFGLQRGALWRGSLAGRGCASCAGCCGTSASSRWSRSSAGRTRSWFPAARRRTRRLRGRNGPRWVLTTRRSARRSRAGGGCPNGSRGRSRRTTSRRRPGPGTTRCSTSCTPRT